MSQRVSFRGVHAKIDRAREHLEALESEVARVLEPDTYAARGQLNADRSEYVIRCEINREPDFMRAGVIFGDAVQNLRSALDHALCRLVLASGGKVGNQHQFPIFVTDPATNDWARRRWARMTEGVDARFMKTIESVQPYNGSGGEPERTPLAILRAYSNADKHTVVVPVALGVSNKLTQRLRPIPRDLEVIGQAIARQDLLLEDGAEILRFRCRPTGPDPHVEMQGHIPVSMAFGEDHTSALGIQHVGTFVAAIAQALESLLDD